LGIYSRRSSSRYEDDGGTLHVGQVFDTMAYDGLGRRVSQTVAGTGPGTDMATHYYDSSGDQVLEERNGSGQVLKQHVWGATYVDELVQTGINADPPDGSEQDVETFYTALQDANFDGLGPVDNSGNLVDRYSYTPYGERTVYADGGANDAGLYAASAHSARVMVGWVDRRPWGVEIYPFRPIYRCICDGNRSKPPFAWKI
jgi:hypothetical protein